MTENLDYVKSTHEDINLATSDNILNETKNFNKFPADVESKLFTGGGNYHWQSGFQRKIK